jgi:hypothetical protein
VPRGRNADDRLANLEQCLEVLEAREASLPERPEYTDEEIVEIGLILLAYVYQGDTERYAEYLVKEGGMPVREAEEFAGTIAHLLEERRKTAENPEYPV